MDYATYHTLPPRLTHLRRALRTRDVTIRRAALAAYWRARLLTITDPINSRGW